MVDWTIRNRFSARASSSNAGVDVVETTVVDNGVAVAGSGETVGDDDVHAVRPKVMLTMQMSQRRHIYVCFIGLPPQKQKKWGLPLCLLDS